MMAFEKNQKCTNCGQPDSFSDETMCHACIAKWRDALILKERNRIIEVLKRAVLDKNKNRNHHFLSLTFSEIKDVLGGLNE